MLWPCSALGIQNLGFGAALGGICTPSETMCKLAGVWVYFLFWSKQPYFPSDSQSLVTLIFKFSALSLSNFWFCQLSCLCRFILSHLTPF